MTAPDHLATRPAAEGDRGFAYQVKRAALGPYVEQVWGCDAAASAPFRRRSSRVDGDVDFAIADPTYW